MLHLMQLLNMIDDKTLFINLFNDLSYEIDELGYQHLDDQCELVNEMLFNHFGLELRCEKQLERITKTIIKHQGRLVLFSKAA